MTDMNKISIIEQQLKTTPDDISTSDLIYYLQY